MDDVARGGAEDGNRSASVDLVDDPRRAIRFRGQTVSWTADENIACYEDTRRAAQKAAKTRAHAANRCSESTHVPRERAIRRGLRSRTTSEYPNEMPRLKWWRSGEKYKRGAVNHLAVTEMVGESVRRGESVGSADDGDVVEHAKEWLRRRTRITAAEHDDDDDDLLGEDVGREDSSRKGTKRCVKAEASRTKKDKKRTTKTKRKIARTCQKYHRRRR